MVCKSHAALHVLLSFISTSESYASLGGFVYLWPDIL